MHHLSMPESSDHLWRACGQDGEAIQGVAPSALMCCLPWSRRSRMSPGAGREWHSERNGSCENDLSFSTSDAASRRSVLSAGAGHDPLLCFEGTPIFRHKGDRPVEPKFLICYLTRSLSLVMADPFSHTNRLRRCAGSSGSKTYSSLLHHIR